MSSAVCVCVCVSSWFASGASTDETCRSCSDAELEETRECLHRVVRGWLMRHGK
jgi:hypothetical protein